MRSIIGPSFYEFRYLEFNCAYVVCEDGACDIVLSMVRAAAPTLLLQSASDACSPQMPAQLLPTLLSCGAAVASEREKKSVMFKH